MAKVAAVLGAGIQGCCAALALRQRGFRVRLYDKSSALMNRASVNTLSPARGRGQGEGGALTPLGGRCSLQISAALKGAST